VAKRPPTEADASGSGLSDIDSYLIDHIRANPGLRFGALVRAAYEARDVPRTTTARHLSRLVRWGELILGPERTYIVGEPNDPTARTVLEVRWYNVAVIIRPNGNARIVSEEELRVVAGRLDHIEFNHPKQPRQFLAWTTAGGRITYLPAFDAPSRLSMHRIDFQAPLTARRSTWHRVCVSVEWPAWYRMARPPTGRGLAARTDSAWEFQSIEVGSLGRRFERRFSPDAMLRLQVVLPDGYPVGKTRCRVRFQTETDRIDVSEERRLAQLSKDELREDGLRRFAQTFTLTVPMPVLDRHYTIEWTLPRSADRRRWLAAQRRKMMR
jgi:hypothetical protein